MGKVEVCIKLSSDPLMLSKLFAETDDFLPHTNDRLAAWQSVREFSTTDF